MSSTDCSSKPLRGPRSAGTVGALIALVTTPASAAELRDAQLAGQRIVTAFRGTTLRPSLASRIRHGEIAGVILFGRNIQSLAQTRKLIADIQAVPRPAALRGPLFVMIDQEGGPVRRLPGGPRAAASILTDAEARAAGREAGSLLRAVGANVNLAPVADVGRPGSFVRLQRRSYGGDSAAVASRVLAFHRGLRDLGILGSAKHFPGLGAARVNTDLAPSRVPTSLAVLRGIDEPPFSALSRDAIAFVMLSSASYPALADGPAVLSRRVVTGELRERLGFRGLTITDSLNAPALRPHGGPGPAAVRAAAAGVDIMLPTSEGAATAVQRSLINALRSGRLRRGPARASVSRILALRATLPRG